MSFVIRGKSGVVAALVGKLRNVECIKCSRCQNNNAPESEMGVADTPSQSNSNPQGDRQPRASRHGGHQMQMATAMAISAVVVGGVRRVRWCSAMQVYGEANGKDTGNR